MNQKIVLGILLAILALTAFASATPTGPKSIIRSNDETWHVWDPLTQEALAGNVSELDFNASSTTRTYQGYYGNITGLIVLGDSSNNTLYDWYQASPQGEIYAVRSGTLPTWSAVTCASQLELQSEDLRLVVNESVDVDSVNRTFVVGGSADQKTRYPTADLSHPQFWVANQSIIENTCPVATMYNSSYEPSTYFKEVLLSDNNPAHTPVTPGTSTEGFVIYTAIIAHTLNPFEESDGFNFRTHDFEMIVGENGHGADIGATAHTSTYWFYVELS